jgi:tetratricopeptide (TPR) repeat protein/tRNA A-37 threonylcarbamoyl transferase component Bud32
VHREPSNPAGSSPSQGIGPYRILKPLGAGGMGEVFLAYDDRLDRRVAVKRIHPEAGANPERRERFRREARMAARLSHPAIVQVFDILQDNGSDYIVMEYVEGMSLRDLVARGPLEVRQVLDLARELADGLDAAHREGIVHRDLKTENILITPSGRPKITDFGIAKRLLAGGEEDSLTGSHIVLGTFRSMSPEQARGEPVDHRTDLFALGVLLYETLTGNSPFAAENAATTLTRVLTHRQTPVRELNPAVSEGLSCLVDCLLEKDPFRRPNSAGQVRRELDGFALSTAATAGAVGTETDDATIVEPLRPLPPATITPLVDRSGEGTGRFRPVRWIAVALALVLIAAVAAVSYRALRRPEAPVYVAVLAPEIGTGAGDGEIELLASGVRVALLQGLTSLEGISPQAFEEVDAVSGTPREIARAVAADELVGSRLDCRTEVCRVALTRRRGGDGSVLWAESLEIPADDLALAASAVRSRIQQGYPQNDVREGRAEPSAARDLDELLRLRRQFEAGRDRSLEPVLAGLAALRQRSPRSFEVYLVEASAFRYRFWKSRDPRDLDRALGLIEEARRLEANDPRPLFELVELALEARRVDLARRSLADLERLVPGDARLFNVEARLLDAEGKSEEALEVMRIAARHQPSTNHLHNLAQMELRQGKIEDARKTLKLLLDRSPRHHDGLYLAAQIELSNGDLNRAAELYGELASISPGLAELSNLGLAYTFLGRYAEAREALASARDLEPGNPFVALNLADANLLLGRVSEANTLYRRVVELIESDPSASSPQFLTVKAQAFAHLDQPRQAVAAVQEALRLAPDQGPVAFEAALVYTLVGEHNSALVLAEKAIRLGIGERWFSLPWFGPLTRRPEFKELLEQARPGLR